MLYSVLLCQKSKTCFLELQPHCVMLHLRNVHAHTIARYQGQFLKSFHLLHFLASAPPSFLLCPLVLPAPSHLQWRKCWIKDSWGERKSVFGKTTPNALRIFTNHTFCQPFFGDLVSEMKFHNIPSLHLPMILCYFVSICLWFQSNCRKFALVGLICLSSGECIIFEFKAIASWSGWKHFFRWMYLYWYCTTFVF